MTGIGVYGWFVGIFSLRLLPSRTFPLLQCGLSLQDAGDFQLLQHGLSMGGGRGNTCPTTKNSPPPSLTQLFPLLFLILFFVPFSDCVVVLSFLKYVSVETSPHCSCCWAQPCLAVGLLELALTGFWQPLASAHKRLALQLPAANTLL